MDLAFLTPLLHRAGPWASVYLDTSRASEDATQRRALLDRTAVRRLAEQGADKATCTAVRDHLAREPVSGSPPGRALFATDGEVVLDVPLSEAPPDVEADWAALPHTFRLLGLLDDTAARCLIAAIDRTGADLEIRDLGRRAQVRTVEGVTWQGRGHRAPPADRYEWHYQHRRENAWERSAEVIAEELARIWPESDVSLLVLTGDVRERRAVHQRLPQQLQSATTEVDGGGRAEGIHAEAFDRRLAEAWQDHQKRQLSATLNAFHSATGRPGEHRTDGAGLETAPGPAAQGIPAVVTAARQRQLSTLLVQEGAPDTERRLWVGPEPEHIGTERNEVRGMGAGPVTS